MSNYVTNYLQIITPTLTQVDRCRYPFQSNYSVLGTLYTVQYVILGREHEL